MFSSNSSQVADDKLFSEDVFSTFVYTGNGSTQTITNGIDLAGKGGMVWAKMRSNATSHALFDTSRGALNRLASNTTDPSSSASNSLTSFNNNGFSLGSDIVSGAVNANGFTYASWTFREAPNFFDVVTWTGNGGTQSIAHSLGTAPGVIIVKSYGSGGSWIVYHQSLGAGSRLFLNATNAAATTVPETVWGNNTTTVAPTSTAFTTGSALNVNGETYVAYLFAHDTTSDGIIQCGSYTGNGSSTGPTVTLGWEPQWLLVKDATVGWDWRVVDNMRGMPVGSGAASLFPNLSNAEFTTSTVAFSPTATGFQVAGSAAQINTSGNTYIYIAIRRGPMRTPTLGTSVFAVDPQNITISSAPRYRSGFVTDMLFWKEKNTVTNWTISSRLTSTGIMSTDTTAAEISSAVYTWDYMNGALNVASNDPNKPAWMFRRAPSFFDEVCYTGTGVTNRTVNHNLGVKPELIIIKRRASAASGWFVAHTFVSASYKYQYLNTTAAAGTVTYSSYSDILYSDPTATEFKLGTETTVNGSGDTFVAYLFASCPGVSKIGTYTGNGSSQTINCGFAAGARFVLIKRTDSTGDWYVWDTARGIVAGNDPHLSLNTTAAEVTSNDTIDTDSSGFVVNQVSATNVNVSSATYIYLAVA